MVGRGQRGIWWVDVAKLDWVITGGRVVLPTGVHRIDIGINNGTIESIFAPGTEVSADRRFDAGGRYVIPGGVDAHVHFENPSMGTTTAHDFRMGTEAALLGGTTTVIDFAFQREGESLLAAIARRRRDADPQVVCDYGLHGCLTSPDTRSIDEIPEAVTLGMPSVKFFMTYREEGWAVSDAQLLAAMRHLAKTGGTALVHAENDELLQVGIETCRESGDLSPGGHARSRPALLEAEAIQRAVLYARESGCRLFVVHVSSESGVEAVRAGQGHVAPVLAETCPHYLAFDDSVLDGPMGHRYVMSPPLRPAGNPEALWRALDEGSLQSVGSDDAAYFEEFKLRGKTDFRKIANGVPGVQIRLPLLFSEGVLKRGMAMDRFVEVTCTEPARIFGLFPKKGVVAVGSDADLVVLDDSVTWEPTVETMHTSIEYTLYEEMTLRGRPTHVWRRGELVVEDGELNAAPGSGRLVRRAPAAIVSRSSR